MFDWWNSGPFSLARNAIFLMSSLYCVSQACRHAYYRGFSGLVADTAFWIHLVSQQPVISA